MAPRAAGSGCATTGRGGPPLLRSERIAELVGACEKSPAGMALLSTVPPRPMPYGRLVREGGKLMKIVESQSARTQPIEIYSKEAPARGEEVVRYVLRPGYTQPETLRQAFAALKSDAGDIQVIGALLLITDHASNVRDMLSIAKLVDVPGAGN